MSRLKLVLPLFLILVNVAFGMSMYPTSQEGGTFDANSTNSYQYTLYNDRVYNTTVGFMLTGSCDNLSSYVSFTPSSTEMKDENESLTFNLIVDTDGMSSGNYTVVFKPKLTINENVSLNPNNIQAGAMMSVIPAATLNFELEVTTTTTTTTAAGGGTPGGGGGGPLLTNFAILNDSVNVQLKQGGNDRVYAVVENMGETSLDFEVEVEGLTVVNVMNDSFDLDSEEATQVWFDVSIDKDTEPNLYSGRLVISTEEREKSIPFYVEVETEEVLFDVDILILEEYKKVLPGENVSFSVSLYNVKRTGEVDVDVEYLVKDLNDSVILSDSETVAVETDKNYIKKILIPLSMEPGKYVLYARVKYDSSVTISSGSFEVTEFYFPTVHPTLLLVMISLIVLIFFYIRREAKDRGLKTKGKNSSPKKQD